MNADEALRRLDAAVLEIVNALDGLQQVPSANEHIGKAIREFFEEAWDHVRLIVALREEFERVEWLDESGNLAAATGTEERLR